MRSNAGRRAGRAGVKGNKPKNTWLAFCVCAGLVLLWVQLTIRLVPKELHDINKAISPHRKEDNSLDERATELGGGSRDKLPDTPVQRRRPRPDKNRPREQTSMDTIVYNMRSFLDELDRVYKAIENPDPQKVWDLYKAATDRWLLPMDRASEGQNLFDIRDDKSIFVSLASYRDENCPTTLKEMYSKADHPELLYIGLVQQNCVSECRTGVLEGGVVEDMKPDVNCYEEFCSTELGAQFCQSGNVRDFFVQEEEALGPAVARYMASKLWMGETYFMQIDAHSLFVPHWDTTLVNDIHNTPSYPMSVLSHYPPSVGANFEDKPGYRICGAEFAKSSVEYDIIRLTAGLQQDKQIPVRPCPAPFIGAGFFFAHSSFLADVPFDPYVPWVFMGEEILQSLRMWTWGYDIYSPTRNVLSHHYVRRHTPKFWETVNRLFKKPTMHNDLTSMVINRVKNIAGYPESSAEILLRPTLLDNLDLYGDGDVRPMEEYMERVGLDMTTKRAKQISWCFKCQPPYPV
ncbi:unnamed protein product [Ectocarpus sp. CCAP 1310/34]|nr:unnamed protein product [Ectocarpus sp. CCAP 1310/34]